VSPILHNTAAHHRLNSTTTFESSDFSRFNEWKDNVEDRGMRVNMNKTKVIISALMLLVGWQAGIWPVKN